MKSYPSADRGEGESVSSPFLESSQWEREYLEEVSPFSESGNHFPTAGRAHRPEPARQDEGWSQEAQGESDEEYLDEELWSRIYEPFAVTDLEVGTGVLQEREKRYGAEQTQFNVRWYQTILKVAGGYSNIAVNGNHNDPKTRSALRIFKIGPGSRKETGYMT